MAEKVIIGNATLYCADCMDILPTLDRVDAVITDPPYGINIRTRVNYQENQKWDAERPDLLPWLALGRYHLFWGGQYFSDKLPMSEAWACWVKRPLDGIVKQQVHSTIEIAWSNFGKPRFFKQVWDGGKREGDERNRSFCHPTQKPVELMAWCIDSLPDDARVVLDPYMGSGTTGIAAVEAGLTFIGIERNPEYFETACKRIEQAVAQGQLFAPEPMKQVQGDLI